jgi:hypothetical protein
MASIFSPLVGLALALACIVLLAGCEGDGYSNSGRPRGVTDCVKVDAKGNQHWFSVPAGQPCPRP